MPDDLLREHLRQVARWVLDVSVGAATTRSELAAVALFDPGERDPTSLAITEVRGTSAPERQRLAEEHGPLSAFNTADWTSLEVAVLDWLLPTELARADERLSREFVARLGTQRAIEVHERLYVDELAARPRADHFELADDFVVFVWNADPAIRSAELRRRGGSGAVEAWASRGWLA